LSKNIVFTFPHTFILAGLLQDICFYLSLFIAKETPKDKHQGKAGGTQMVIISRDLTIISSKST
jgi:hypothetical protein